MNKAIKVTVVDDQYLFRKGLISLLADFDQVEIVGEADNGQELISQLPSSLPDLILMDLEMPLLDGIKTTEYLKLHYPEIKILVLSMHNEDEMILHLLEKGASGFIQKNDTVETIVNAITQVYKNGYYMNEKTSKVMMDGFSKSKKSKPSLGSTPLSDREIEVVKLMSKEYKNEEIARKLFINVRTVNRHRENIIHKINAKNSIGVIMYAVKNNLLD